MPIVVVPYDPAWPVLFHSLKERLWPAVAGHALAIEHVGSTSVPGLAAKPVIDIDIVVDSPALSAKAIEGLTTLGYAHGGDRGIVGREWMQPPTDTPRHNLYVCLSDAESYQNHIALRDYLRANPDSVREYGELKFRLAEQFPDDIDAYVEAKSDFIARVLEASGFEGEALRRIREANRKPAG